MKKFNLIGAIFLAMLVIFSFSSVKAQDETQVAPDAPNRKDADNRRPNLLAELGLTQDQIQQIRRVNVEKKPSLRQAQQRLREANRNLDAAIYAETADEAEIQMRIKEVQTAQAEVIKFRSLTELAVRRILTPEQLSKFRELRRQFMENTGNRPNRIRKQTLNAPNRRINNRAPASSGN